jgi:metallo-beta-lactamase family protein
MHLTFLGAAKTVTGSKYLLAVDNKKILVDCGLFQGMKELRKRNWHPLPIAAKDINAVILTHAHIDHSGYIPLLVKNGFKGRIYCSQATKDLCSILLPDSGFLQEEEARFVNKHGFSKHKPALPLYTAEDAQYSLQYFQPLTYGTHYDLENCIDLTLMHAGHILGASFVKIAHENTQLLFSGDIGRMHDPVMHTPAIIQKTDYLILESTYGNRQHSTIDPLDELERIIKRAVQQQGVIVIPAFAVGRAQNVLYYLYQLKKTNRIPNIPVYLDSPMAISATKVFSKYANEHRLSKQVCQEVCEIATYITTQEESKELNNQKPPMIIISASGMIDGGRVLHHIKYFASNPNNTILLVGYQAEGTRGAQLLAGRRHLKIFGEEVPVNATVIEVGNMSAHADYQEILTWLSNFQVAPRKTFITHGEPESANALKMKIEQALGWECVVPEYLAKEEL